MKDLCDDSGNENLGVTLELTYGAVADSIRKIPSVLKGLADPEENEEISLSRIVEEINKGDSGNLGTKIGAYLNS